MRSPHSPWMVVIQWMLIALAVAGLAWANLAFVKRYPGGQDFRAQWVALRAWVIQGVDPYAPGVAAAAERLAYGREASPGEQRLSFNTPLYAAIFTLPFALVADFELARALWMLFCQACLVGWLLLAIRLNGWKPGRLNILLLACFGVAGYYPARALVNGDLIFLTALLLGFAWMELRAGRDEIAGLLLAVATIQPQVTLLAILFTLVWSGAHRRWSVLGWFLAGMAILIILGVFFIPGWPLEYLRIVWNYRQYLPDATAGRAFLLWWPGLGQRLGWILTALSAALLLAEWAAARRKDFRHCLWTASLTLALSPLLGLPTDPKVYVLLLLPLALVFTTWEQRMGRVGRWLVRASLVLLLAGLWALFGRLLAESRLEEQEARFLFQLPLFLLGGLYWVRWWAVRPALFIEELRSHEIFR